MGRRAKQEHRSPQVARRVCYGRLDPISEIKRAEADEKKENKKENTNNKNKKFAATSELVGLAPTALEKLEKKGGNVSKITIAETRTILLRQIT